MKNYLKWKLEELRDVIWYSGLFIVAIALLGFGIYSIQHWLYPAWLDYQRDSVENSKSFVDANNNMLETYKLEYVRLDTKIEEAKDDQSSIKIYKAQQKAILEKMCKQISTMKKNTVNSDTQYWLGQKGACK